MIQHIHHEAKYSITPKCYVSLEAAPFYSRSDAVKRLQEHPDLKCLTFSPTWEELQNPDVLTKTHTVIVSWD